jgi:hypothetical protein
METKEPAVLAVLVESARLRWLVASINLDGTVSPLLRSEDGNLAAYQGLGFDDQVSFLRHRLCGVLQRGCDRLWPVGKKACLFAILFDGELPGTTAELTRRVAEHFVDWILNPPVVIFTSDGGPDGSAPPLRRLAGTSESPYEAAFHAGLAALRAAAADPDAWEVSCQKGTWKPPSGEEG